MDAVTLGPGLGQPPPPMDQPEFYVGVDVASETLAVALTRGPGRTAAKPLAVTNDPDGSAALAAWLAEHAAAPDQALVCLESTGVYGEALCYGLHDHGFRVVVEDAAKVRRAMPVAGAKTDALDALRIADYAARFLDDSPVGARRGRRGAGPDALDDEGAAHARADGEAERAPDAPAEGGPDAAGYPDR